MIVEDQDESDLLGHLGSAGDMGTRSWMWNR
jgi:hypothetical protein